MVQSFIGIFHSLGDTGSVEGFVELSGCPIY